MKLVYDDVIDPNLKEYLISQNDILDVSITTKDFISEVNIKYNSNITPSIIFKYIELFQNFDNPCLLEFDKAFKGNYKKLHYSVHDMCCDYCYKGVIKDMFENKNIKSVKSNYDVRNSCYNIDFVIEYEKSCEEEKIKKYVDEKLKGVSN